MTRTGAPLANAPITPVVPTPTPMSTLPEITACCVSPPPCVQRISSSSPCFLKMPASLASVRGAKPVQPAYDAVLRYGPIAAVPQACKEAGIVEQTFYRWRKEYGGLQVEQAKKLKELQRENAQLRRAVADLTVEKAPGAFGWDAVPAALGSSSSTIARPPISADASPRP